MPEKRYLSTDPNAGAADAPAKKYLSTDPAAGGEESTAPEPPEKSDGRGAMATGLGVGSLAAAIPVARNLAERVATSPMVGGAVAKLAPMAGAANLGKLGYDLVTGKNPLQSMISAGKGELARQGAKFAYRAAAPVAEALGTAGAAGMAGGLAGVAGTAGFLGALQHDANRKVEIDYSKNSLDTTIARAFGNLQHSEANAARIRDERMDDPNDPLFQPDDSAEVSADPLRRALMAQLGGGR